MPAVVIVGAQWGDEGKGKIVDLISQYSNVVVRYGGGANAGHTLVVDGKKVVLHLVPSGALNPHVSCILGQGTVVDPRVLLSELRALEASGVELRNRFLLSSRAHVVLPHHVLIDTMRERGGGAIGTTKRGIGPAYEDKVGRRGIRVGDLLHAERFRERLRINLENWVPLFRSHNTELPTLEEIATPYLELAEQLRPYITDTGIWLAAALEKNAKVLLEGAQGTLLDIDHGTYPYVTSSTSVAGGACAGAGIGPTHIRRVIGVSKAYTTRVGSGPFPTELHDDLGARLRQAGAEFGATTGRPRRCGWLDIPSLRCAVRVNGMQELVLTKMDVLTGFDPLRLCIRYNVNGRYENEPPFDGFESSESIYETMEGWSENLQACRSIEELPRAATRYIQRIKELIACKVSIIGIGTERHQVLGLHDPFAG